MRKDGNTPSTEKPSPFQAKGGDDQAPKQTTGVTQGMQMARTAAIRQRMEEFKRLY